MTRCCITTEQHAFRVIHSSLDRLLGALAHNVIVWSRQWLTPHEPKVRRYGLLRMVRDVFHLSGCLIRNAQGRIVEVVLNQQAPLVRGLARSLDVLLRPAHIAVRWGKI